MSAKVSHHGMTHAKGCAHLRLGNFGKLFDEAAVPPLAVGKDEAEALGGPGGIMHDAGNSSPDSDIPAAYIFFAQFIDHDITLDTTTGLHDDPKPLKDIEKLPNLRSPSLDLDCVYGFGPEANPFLYDQKAPGRMLTGNPSNPDDLPRNSDGRALIGDPRNDENIFIAQLQLAFLRLHNRRIVGRSFEDAQQDCRYHYQWLVLHDFLKKVCHPDVYQFAMEQLKKNDYPKKKIGYPLCYKPDEHGRLPMPVEFSVAAYRFGHSMVRSLYAINTEHPVVELFDERFGTLGFTAVPPELVVDWRFMLDVGCCHEYVRAKAIDHLLADELIRLPDPVVGKFTTVNDRSLAFRNLLRGNVLGLGSGQDIAKALADKGYCNLKVDLDFDRIKGWDQLPQAMRDKLSKQTPLFFYLMREAGVGGGHCLGPVGSAILLEVFCGLLVYCNTSFLHDKGGWEPDPCIARNGPEKFVLADVMRYLLGLPPCEQPQAPKVPKADAHAGVSREQDLDDWFLVVDGEPIEDLIERGGTRKVLQDVLGGDCSDEYLTDQLVKAKRGNTEGLSKALTGIAGFSVRQLLDAHLAMPRQAQKVKGKIRHYYFNDTLKSGYLEVDTDDGEDRYFWSIAVLPETFKVIERVDNNPSDPFPDTLPLPPDALDPNNRDSIWQRGLKYKLWAMGKGIKVLGITRNGVPLPPEDPLYVSNDDSCIDLMFACYPPESVLPPQRAYCLGRCEHPAVVNTA